LDFNDPHQMKIFIEVHDKLPREGPGNRAATEQAFGLTTLPQSPHILDIGCGPGMQTLDLADFASDARLHAIDLHPAYVQEARRRVAARGYGDRISVSQADMTALPFEPNSFDLVWSEGAAYIMGVEKALTEWRKLLRPQGFLSFTEIVWLRNDAPEEIRAWWTKAYPDMRSLAAHRVLAESCGYRVTGDFVLPEEAWWEDYYSPMQSRIGQLRSKYARDPIALAVLDYCLVEIDNYRRYSAFYSYAFLVLELRG